MAWGGRYRFTAISVPVVEDLWDSLYRVPPKEAMVVLVVKAMVPAAGDGCFLRWVLEPWRLDDETNRGETEESRHEAVTR